MKATLCVFLVACAGSRPNVTPASQPAYVMLDAGQAAPVDGFFLSVPDARSKLLSDRMYELQRDQDVAEAQLERDSALKRASHAAWCVKWCVSLGAVSVVVVEGIAFGLFEAVRR